MKTITIAGNIGKDAQTRDAGSDKATSFSVAVEERKGQDKRTIWFDCTIWGKRGEVLRQYLTKGGKVAVSGDLSTREHDGRTYLTIRVDNVTLMGASPSRSDQTSSDSANQADNASAPLDDEIPF